MKHCPSCSQDLPRAAFYPKGKGPTGTVYRTRLCRECHRAARPRQKENRWAKTNPEKWAAYMREWRKKNPGHDHRSKYLFGRLRLKPQQWQELVEGFGGCAYCGQEATEIDHFAPRDLGGSDDWSNLVPACRTCNAMKNNRHPKDWCSPDTFDRISAILSCERAATLG